MPSFLVEAVLRILVLEVEALGHGTTTLGIADGDMDLVASIKSGL
ncbi:MULTISPECIES: hypothetical protein [Methylobacterium]|jgi:hypothetical protein|uniref:Uncharacterized protein n=1 Tax=Methylobacterium goesingense TaxID=243690 RepID=A0ABV2L2G4_9HYPH|nr:MULTISPECIES: hypothetical protein [Methylobacterium]MDO9427736.1 hypothetical protein [Methylobacterium sp.]